MGALRQAHTRPDTVTMHAAVAAFLDTFPRPEQVGTRRTYGEVLAQLLRSPLPRADPVGRLDEQVVAAQLCDWFAYRWAATSPATWNRNLACVRSACAYWRAQHWITGDPTAALVRATLAPHRARARSRTAIADLLARPDLALRDRALWALLYESAARAQEVLLLDVTDLDRPNRRAVVRRKGGAVDEITWQTRTARLLARHLSSRTRGPVFLTARAARVQLAAGDLDPDTGRARLSYRRAAELFTQAAGGWTLHDLRHSALTHAAEDGMPTPMLMTKSGHASIRTLSRYSRPSVDALARWQDNLDPASRRGGAR
jgi:integrase/recombinase XerC/integrase/recombinase XerD